MTEPTQSLHQHGMHLLRRALIAGVALGAACGDNVAPTAAPALPEVALVPAAAGSDVDLLFVISNLEGAGEYGPNLSQAFPGFVADLSARPAGLPNLHVGVISSDLGTSSTGDPTPAPAVASCSGDGAAGALHTGAYLSDVAGPSGTRITSYSGALADAFAPLAGVGTLGCAFSQPIEAVVRALDNNPANSGFRRPGAALAVVFVADEDDCSLAHGELTTSDTSALGPLQTFRCMRYGVTCMVGGKTPDEMNAAGPKAGCRANDGSPYLAPLDEPQHFLEGAVPDLRDVLVAGIIGDPTPVDVELRQPQAGAQPIPVIAPSCTFGDSSGATVAANPGIRLADFIGRFRHHVVASECTGNFGPALDQIALQIGNLLGDPCVPVTVPDPTSCEAFDEGPGGVAPVSLPACGGATATNCFTLAPDAAACPLGNHLALHVTRAQPASPGTMTSLRCAP